MDTIDGATSNFYSVLHLGKGGFVFVSFLEVDSMQSGEGTHVPIIQIIRKYIDFVAQIERFQKTRLWRVTSNAISTLIEA